MKKLFTLMMLCLSVSATAWADFTESWTSAAPPHSRPIISTYPSGMSYTGDNKVHAVTQVIQVGTSGPVSVTLSITAGTLNVLGIDLATANGTVQASYYTAKELTTSDGSYTATLANVPAGYYVLRYFVYNNTTDNADLTSTTGSLRVTGAVQAPVISNVAGLSNDKVYLVKSGRTTASKDVYLLYNSNVSGYLSSNYDEESKNTSLYDGLDNFQFAIYKHTDNKYYFYIPKGNKIVGNATGNNAAIPLGFLADTDMEIRTTSTVDNYPFLLSTNRSGALNAADTDGKHGVVNWSDGYGQTGDTGNAFQFIEAGDLADGDKTLVQNKIMYAPDYRTAQALFSVDLAYVGQYIYADLEPLSTALTNFANSTTVDNYNTMMTEYNQARSTASRVTLGNGEIFQIKCTNASRGYLAYYNTTVSNTFDGATTLTLAGANGWNAFPNIDAANVYTTWAMYKYNDKCYLYSTENKKFIKAEANDRPLTFTEDVAQASPVTLENIDGNDVGWRLKFVDANYYISFSPGYGLNGGARTYNVASDGGVQHYLIKTGSSVSNEDAGSIARKIQLHVLASKTPTLGTGIGEYTYSGSNQATDEANIATAKSYVDGTVTPTEAEILAAITNMTNLFSSLTINQPKVDKLYRLKGKVNAKYVTGNLTSHGGNQKMALSAENGVETVFMFRDAENGKFKLLNVGNGFYINNTWAIGSSNTQFDQFTFEASPTNIGYYVPKTNQSSCYMYNNTDRQVVDRQGSYDANVCDWEIEEVTWLPVPIYDDEHKLGTFYSPVALYKDESRIKFYTGTVTNNYFNLTQYTGDVIPANKAFITEYIGDKSNECAYLQIASDPSLTTKQQEQPDNNQLEGQFETITTPTITGKTICTMQEIGGKLTFASYTGTTVKGFRAYLPVDNSTTGGGDSSFRLVFGVPTGIDTIGNQPAQEQTVYDLSGRRVEHAGKGLYIVNGKKVMIK